MTRKKIEVNLLEENCESSEESFLQVEEISTVESSVKRWFAAGSAFTVNKPSMKPPSSAILILVRLAMYSATEIHLSLHKKRIHPKPFDGSIMKLLSVVNLRVTYGLQPYYLPKPAKCWDFSS